MNRFLKLYAAELEAEESFGKGDYATASEKLQELLDSGAASGDDKGWYLQEMARYQYRSNRTESESASGGRASKQSVLAKTIIGRDGCETDDSESGANGAHRKMGEWLRELF